MSIVAVAFVPSAPLLVPAVAGGSAALDEPMRAASLSVVRECLAAAPEQVLVLAPADTTAEHPATATWDFAGFGVARTPPVSASALPWPLGLGAWLLDECGWSGARRYLGVGPGPAPTGVSPDDARTVVLAVGDGSACRTERAPGYLDERAEAFDAEIAGALGRGDGAALAGLDTALADELLCRSLPVWRWVVAAAVGSSAAAASLPVAAAPYGVGYFVAHWTFAR